jgi:glutamine synthetase
MPKSIHEAMDALAADGALNEALAPGLVEGYLRVKEGEVKMLEDMGVSESRIYLIERY